MAIKQIDKKEKSKKNSIYSKSVVSALVGSSIVIPLSMPLDVFAKEGQKDIEVEYKYVVESELSQKEKASLKKFVAEDEVAKDQRAYYFVYKKSGEITSPKTDDNTPLGLNLLLAGSSLLVLAVYVTKGKKKNVATSLFVLSLASGVFLSQASAVENKLLAEFSKTIELSSGEELPSPPETIKGYKFTGYFLTVDKDNQIIMENNQNEQRPSIDENEKEETSTGEKGDEKDQSTGDKDEEKPSVDNKEEQGSSIEEKEMPDEEKEEDGKEPVEPQITYEDVEIDFETEEIPDDTLEEGIREVITIGEKGIKRITKSDGKITNEEIVKNPTNERVKIGTKPKIKEPTITYEDIEIPFTIEEIPDPSLDKGERVVDVKGENGIKKITRTDGDITLEEIIKEPITEKVRIGSKEIGYIDEERREIIPYVEERVDDDTLWVGEERIDVLGTNGEKKIITRYRTENGQKVGEPISTKEEIITPSVNQVKKIGTKDIKGTEVRELFERTPFETRRVADEELYDDQEIVDVVGEEGTDKITITYETEKGVNTGKEIGRVRETVTPPVNRIIKYGTKKRPIPTITLDSIDGKSFEDIVENTVFDKDVDQTVSVTVNLTNAESIVSKKYKLNKEGILVKEANFEDEITLDGLEYDKDYSIEGIITYVQNGQEIEVKDARTFRLELKKIELKDIKEYRVIKKDGTEFLRTLNLLGSENPQDYFVEIVSKEDKKSILPVTSISLEEDRVKVVMDIDDLVENRDGTYGTTHDFFMPKRAENQLTFKQLLEEIRNNPNGTFTLNGDISASEVKLSEEDKSYLDDVVFTGKLLGLNGSDTFAIQDLVKPLFKMIDGGTVQFLDLRNVKMESANTMGALAISTNNANIKNVAVQGSIIANGNIGGLVGTARNTVFENVMFQGTINNYNDIATSNSYKMNMGGIVGEITGGRINKAKVFADLRTYATSNYGRAGAIAGRAGEGNTGIRNVYATGTVENKYSNGGQVGGLIGSLWNTGQLDNGVSGVKVINGNIIYGDSGDKHPDRVKNSYAITDVASGNPYQFMVGSLTKEEAEQRVDNMFITVELEDTDRQVDSEFRMSYSSNELLHKNIEKFLPYYNKSQIEKNANKVLSNEELKTKKILSVTPMKDNEIVNRITNPADINKIMVNFEMGKVKYYDVEFVENFNKYVAEYNVAELGIIYTPDMFIYQENTGITSLAEEFNTIDFYSKDLATILGVIRSNEETKPEDEKLALIRDRMFELSLEATFNNVKANMTEILKNILAQEMRFGNDGINTFEYNVRKIRENKEAFIMGLSYLKKWYPINFENFNIGDNIIFNKDFEGDTISGIDYIISIGNKGYWDLKLTSNLNLFKSEIGKGSKGSDLFDFLEKMKDKFTNYENMEDWFKNSTTMYYREANLGENNEHIVKFYEKMTEPNKVFNPFLLPLLTSREGIYAVATANGIHFGMYDRYIDMRLKETNPTEYATRVSNLKREVDIATERQRNLYNFWYNIVGDQYKEKLIRDLTSWDGYSVVGKGWVTKENATETMKDFFVPMGKYYKSNGSGAYANGALVHFVADSLLNPYGTSVFSHEMIHNNDGSIYFDGNGRRNGIGAEYFAYGLLQTPHAFDDTRLGINSMFDFSDRLNDPNRVHNASPDRVNTREKLEDYMRKTFDIIYTMDYAEAEILLSKGEEVQKKWYGQITTQNGNPNSSNVRVALADGLNLSTIDDLIDNEVFALGLYGTGNSDRFGLTGANTYHLAFMFSPIYAGGENTQGASGDLMFRRNAFEFLAYKGWENGFLPFVSNKLHKDAVASGLPKVTDTFAIQKISDGEFNSINEFKKEMFKQRYEKRNQLKPITINHNGRDILIDSYDKLKEVLENEVNTVLSRNNNTIWQLKRKIFSAYLRSTNDFVEDVYQN